MRAKSIFIIMTLFISALGFSQIRYGVKAGINGTNIMHYHQYSNTRVGLQLGGYAQIPLDDESRFYLQPELVYLQHGEKNEGDGYQEKYFLNYIAVPVMLKYYVGDNLSTFFLEFGPQFAYNITQDTSTTLTIPSALSRYGAMGDDIAKFDISLGLGAGYSINREIEMAARINYGFTDVYPDTIGENSAKVNVGTTIAFSLFYTFN